LQVLPPDRSQQITRTDALQEFSKSYRKILGDSLFTKRKKFSLVPV